MGAVEKAWNSHRSWGSVGTVLGWAASRLQPHWAARIFQEDEEALALTQTDELSRTYGGGDGGSSPNITASGRSAATVARPRPRNGNHSGDLREAERAFKHVETTLTSTGSSMTATTSLLDGGERAQGRNPARSVLNDLTSSTNQSNTKCSEGLATSPQAEEACDREIPQRDPDGDTKSPSLTRTRERPSLGRARVPGSDAGGRGGVGGGVGDGEGRPAPPQSRGPAGPQDEQRRSGQDAENGSLQSPSAGGAACPIPTITTWEAGWNVTNAIQGVFVLGLPYALVHSGYLGLVLLVLSAWLCNHTGKVLVACLYEEENHRTGPGSAPGRVRVRQSYQDIAEACCQGLWPDWAGVGGFMVNMAQVIELLMTCTLYLVVSASLLRDSLWWMAVPRAACSLASFAFLLPCLWLTDLRPVSTLSMLCSLAHVLISLLVILYCLSVARGWSLSAMSLAVDPEDFLVSAGVIIFSYTSQIFLPTLEGSMEDRGQFTAMLGLTHAAACILKTSFSLLAVLTWGRETSEVITDNLPADLRPLVNLCLLAKALLSYPLPFYSAAQTLQTSLLRGDAASASSPGNGRRPGVSRPALLIRGALLLTSYLLALLVPKFSLLMGLTGSVTGAAMTLTLPCLFHLRLRWRRLGNGERLTDVAILSLGVVCSTAGVVCSLKRIIQGL